jgi:hypothetical protein
MEMTSFGGILRNTDQIIDRHLLGSKDGPKRFRHKRVALDLKQAPHGFNAQVMLEDLIKKIRRNLESRGAEYGQSSENWRTTLQPNIDEKNNKSKETKLEKGIAKALKASGRMDWWNQMPIASGLVGKHADTRRAIDLVHRLDDRGSNYEFVELKVRSDTPLFALMEIVLYGLVYLVLRKQPKWLPEASGDASVFSAHNVGLRVLAPKDYFKRFHHLAWLEEQLNDALPKIVESLDFGEQFGMNVRSHWPSTLEEWDDKILGDDSRLLSCLADWRTAFSR